MRIRKDAVVHQTDNCVLEGLSVEERFSFFLFRYFNAHLNICT